MEQIEVTANFDGEGKITPKTFIWGENQFRVDGIGRRWEGEDGEHMLVMVLPKKQVFELVFDKVNGIWGMVKKHDHPFRKMA